jgi:hypothetical protein
MMQVVIYDARETSILNLTMTERHSALKVDYNQIYTHVISIAKA